MMRDIPLRNCRYIGVSPVKRGPRSALGAHGWQGRIRVGGKKIRYLGLFPTPEEAAQAYDNAAYYLHVAGRDKLKLNFPDTYLGRRDSPPMTEETVKAVEEFKAARASRLKVRQLRGDAEVQSVVERMGWELTLMSQFLGGPKHFEAATQLDKVQQLHKELASYLSSPATCNSQLVTPSSSPATQCEVDLCKSQQPTTEEKSPATGCKEQVTSDPSGMHTNTNQMSGDSQRVSS